MEVTALKGQLVGNSTASFLGIYKIRRFTPAFLPERMQIALKPASKGLGLHRVFIRGKGRMYVVTDSAFKRMQVDARAC